MVSNLMILQAGMHGLVSPGVSYICKSQCHHLELLVLRCPEEQNSGTEHGVTPDNQVLISLTSTGQKDEINIFLQSTYI